jgi:hypothetical protein
MPIEKDGEREPSGSRLPWGKAAWGVVIAFVISLALAFILGIWTYYIVQFFMKGWNTLAG